MTKQELRKEYKNKRSDISPKERLKLDDLLLLQFQQLDYTGITALLTYWPMQHQSEPNTHLFSGYLRHMLPGLKIAYPVTDAQTHHMTAVIVEEDTVYRANAWNIMEPHTGMSIDPGDIDAVLVPMLVCDAQGQRIGYGKGFYDRYLARCRKEVVKIGLCYFEPVAPISDTHQFDIPLTYCITPQHIYEF